MTKVNSTDTKVALAEVVGAKNDAAVTTVGTVATIMAYLKGVLNQLATIASNVTSMKATSLSLGTPKLFTGELLTTDVREVMKTLLTVNGSGVLCGIMAVGKASGAGVRFNVYIDGVLLNNIPIKVIAASSTTATAYQNGTISCLLPFKTSLRIDGERVNYDVESEYCIAYTLN